MKKLSIDEESSHSSQRFSLDSLYCEEETWEETEEDSCESTITIENHTNPFLDISFDDEELLSLLSKERESHISSPTIFEKGPFFSAAREEAVEWILKVIGCYGFSTLTGILAINYLDRFLSSFVYEKEKPWLIHLASVASLSLAAKVEEIHAPLLLDLQVESSKYVFEAKTIQKMELLMLSTLKWRMNPVTPLSFLDHVTRRLRFNHFMHRQILRRCHSLLLSIVRDARSVRYLPSVVAAATMLEVIKGVEICNGVDYQNQLLHILKISKKKVKKCCELISEIASTNKHKRKYDEAPNSTNGVVHAFLDYPIRSSDSWTVESSIYSAEPEIKRRRSNDQIVT